MGKWLAGIIASIIAGVAVFYITQGGREEPSNKIVGQPNQANKSIIVRCSSNPSKFYKVRGVLEISVTAISQRNIPVSRASVRLETSSIPEWMSESRFVENATQTVLGITNDIGLFVTKYRYAIDIDAFNRGARKHQLVIQAHVAKEGIGRGEAECMTGMRSDLVS